MFSTLSKREIIITATFTLLSANAFNLVLSINLMFDKGFLFPHTIPTFSGPQKDSFENIVEKVENAGMICFAFG